VNVVGIAGRGRGRKIERNGSLRREERREERGERGKEGKRRGEERRVLQELWRGRHWGNRQGFFFSE
jgi:hypothetical protein